MTSPQARKGCLKTQNIQSLRGKTDKFDSLVSSFSITKNTIKKFKVNQ